MIEQRLFSRRKNSQFKPLNDIDFAKHQRFTHSYVEIPKFYPNKGSNFSELSKEVLNTKIVSVPHGSEHTSFRVNSKNDNEINLFQAEDQKYEYDINLMKIKRTIKLLESLKTDFLQ